MRFSQLTLVSYGHFETCTLAFPRGEMDFHLVYGANEAGKSTTMSAMQDLLFGFPNAKAYHFRFDASLQRVGAVLDTQAGSLTVRRRRGTKGTLRDDADTPLDETAFASVLCGLSGEAFRQKFSLDHARLRAGGRAIVEAKDDVGQALFAAGSGVLGAQALLAELRGEADAIWAERRSQGRSYWQAERTFTEAAAQKKSALVRPKDWSAARDTLDAHIATRERLQHERAGHQIELDRLLRIRGLAAAVQQRAALRASLDAPGAQPFDATLIQPAHDALYERACRSIETAELRLHVAQSAAGEAEAARQAIGLDDVVLAHKPAIADLFKAAGGPREGASDLPEVEAEMLGLQAEVDRLVRDLGLQARPLAAQLDSLPSPALLADLSARQEKGQELRTRLQEAREQQPGVLRKLDQTRRDLDAHAVPVLPSGTQAALDHAKKMAGVADRLRERCAARAAAETALAACLRGLHPWEGSPDALASIAPPDDATLASAELSLATAETSLRDAARSEVATAELLQRLELEAQHLARARRAVSVDEIAAARSERQHSWLALRQRLTAPCPPPAAQSDMVAHEKLVGVADGLADERFETAEASARLAALSVDIALARHDLDHARAAHDRAGSALSAGLDGWSARLAACGLPNMAPADARRWCERRVDALAKRATLAEALQREAEDLDTVAASRADLLAVAGASARPESSLASLIDHVQRLVDEHADHASRRAMLQTTERMAADAVQDGQDRLASRQAQLDGWAADWSDSVSRAGLAIPPDTLPALLPLIGRLRDALDAALRQQARITGINRRQARFAAEVLQLAASCDVSDPSLDPFALTDRMADRLQRALQDQRAASDLDNVLDRHRTEAAEARRIIAAAEALLAPLLAIAGTSDRALLGPAIEAARTVRAARASLEAVEATIRAGGEGRSLDALVAEVSSCDPGTIEPGITEARTHIAECDNRISLAAQAVGQAQAAVQALDHGGDAALAATDEEQARAALSAEADAYLLKRTQAVMLSWAVDSYRKRRESPLLNRAGALFSSMTLGRYTGLDIDRSADKPRLVAACADGRSVVTLDGMSDGTADQLFLALRLAALEQAHAAGLTLPFLADDLFINFDDRRAHAGFRVLGEIARRTQVLFFTHHQHLRDIAQDALGPHTVPVCELG